MMLMYKGRNGKVAGVIVFIEEAIPFIDVDPTFSIMWTYNYYLSEKPSK